MARRQALPRTPFGFEAGTVGREIAKMGGTILAGGPGEVVADQRLVVPFGTVGTVGRHFAAHACARAKMTVNQGNPFLARKRKTPSLPSLPSQMARQGHEMKGKNFWPFLVMSLPDLDVSLPAVPA